MLKNFAAVLIAASMLSAPALAAGNGAPVAPAKAGIAAHAKVGTKATTNVVTVKRVHTVHHGKRHVVVKHIKRAKVTKHARHVHRMHVAKTAAPHRSVTIVKKVTR